MIDILILIMWCTVSVISQKLFKFDLYWVVLIQVDELIQCFKDYIDTNGSLVCSLYKDFECLAIVIDDIF